MDVDLLPKDEVQQQVEGTLVHRRGDVDRHVSTVVEGVIRPPLIGRPRAPGRG